MSHTDLKIDYKYNSHAMSSPSPLLNVTVAVPVDGGVKSMQSKPESQWYKYVYSLYELVVVIGKNLMNSLYCTGSLKVIECYGNSRNCHSIQRTMELVRCGLDLIWNRALVHRLLYRHSSIARALHYRE